MSLKNIIITGSIGSIPTQSYGQKMYVSSTDEQSFPIESFTGSSGGSTPDFYGEYATTNLFVNITQSWSASINTPAGIVSSIHDTQEEFINGEYSGSTLIVSHQDLINEADSEYNEYGDSNVVLNNVETNQSSSFYRQVNYDTGELTPTNFQQIISQSAEFAEVNDYNYASRANVLPRYNGVKVTQQNENVWTDGDVSFGKKPNVQVLSTYFAYFNFIGSTYNELINKSAVHILYLIDEDGNTLSPTISSSYYYNLIDNFTSGEKLKIILNSTSGSLQIIDNIPILRSGARPIAIIASSTGTSSINNATISTMSFGTTDTNVPNFNSMFGQSLFSPDQTINTGSRDQLTFSTTYFAHNMSLSGSIIRPTANSFYTKIALSIDFSAMSIAKVKPGAPSNIIPLTISIDESLDGGATYPNTFVLPTVNINYNTTSLTYNVDVDNILFTSNFFEPNADRRYKIYLYNESVYFSVTVFGAQVRIIQNPQSLINIPISSSYFTTSSANTLVSSYSMSQIYNENYPYKQILKDQLLGSSGYVSFVPFQISPGDQIRFESDESQTYNIVRASRQGFFSNMSITLDRNVESGTNVSSFLIRKYNPHPMWVTIDSDLEGYNNGGGFILPQHANNALMNNFNKNIELLKTNGLIV